MSGNNFLKSSVIVGASVVALTLGACASSGGSGSRYGNVYDYESGGNCNAGASCGAVVTPPAESRYGSTTVIGGQPVSPGVVYTDCSNVAAMGCGAPAPAPTPPVAYSPPSMVQTQSSGYTSPPSMSYSGEAVSCPAGTMPAGGGTCMMTGSGTYTGSTTTTTTTGSTSWSGSSSSNSGWSNTTTSGGTVDCPANTTKANDGTCMMNSGTTPSVTIYPTTPTPGYQPPVDYTAPVYQPPRK